jgi:hypothetical protein
VNNNCSNICGDGIMVPPEECDNQNHGCFHCKTAVGYVARSGIKVINFSISPRRYNCSSNNTCVNICGDHLVVPPEECDNSQPGTIYFFECSEISRLNLIERSRRFSIFNFRFFFLFDLI